jgi:hypothetical protein
MATEYATIVVKRGGADEWAGSAIPLASGEWGYDETNGVAKIGDGFSPWADLPIHLTASGDGELPPEVRARLAENLADPTTVEGAALADAIAAAGGGGGGGAAPLAYDPQTGLYSVPDGSALTYDSASGLYTTN